MGSKLYKSEAYMRRLYVVKKMTPEEIAKQLGVSHMTIYRALRDHGLMKKL